MVFSSSVSGTPNLLSGPDPEAGVELVDQDPRVYPESDGSVAGTEACVAQALLGAVED